MPLNREELDRVLENRLLSRWSDLLPRRHDQPGSHQADAELVPLGDGRWLALTVDTVAEEIALGFYTAPETIGWMGAAVSLSDLAAVAARPLGLLVSVTLPQAEPQAFQEGVARGLAAACQEAGVHVLGGDTNQAEQVSITSCAAGIVEREQPLTRVGCSVGERVYASGLLGAGASCAARVLLDLPAELYAEADYRPRARLREAPLVARFASCCMDTSDGLLTTLDQLARLNGSGFEVTAEPASLLDPRSRGVCAQVGVPPSVLLAAQHGEFELVFTVAEADGPALEAAAREQGWSPVLLGRVTREGLRIGGELVDGARIRNLLQEAGGDPRRYLQALIGLLS